MIPTTSPREPVRYNGAYAPNHVMVCFCGCSEYVKHPNGYKIGCVQCGHGPQNHEDEFRVSARGNESSSQKRDADFG